MKGNIIWLILGLLMTHPLLQAEARLRTPAHPEGVETKSTPSSGTQTKNCQIIYLVGLEGSSHHGSSDVLRNFAAHQTDSNGQPYNVHFRSKLFRRIAGVSHSLSEVTDEHRRGIMHHTLCPNNGRHHVILEDTSFPSGLHHRRKWKGMNATQIANQTAQHPHPVDLVEFAQVLSEFGDIHIIVLHRPFVNTILSRVKFDKGIVHHTDVEAGTALYLANNVFSDPSFPPWTLVCVEHFKEGAVDARDKTLQRLASYLQWPNATCPTCFDHWRDSNKDPKDMIDDKGYQYVMEMRQKLLPLWPPMPPNGVPVENCPL